MRDTNLSSIHRDPRSKAVLHSISEWTTAIEKKSAVYRDVCIDRVAGHVQYSHDDCRWW